ncbi:hypothetical protein I4U23_020070 [Adineta vaga]|nr:hypothetical protein I4U23_020070 [Adineta vaga]
MVDQRFSNRTACKKSNLEYKNRDEYIQSENSSIKQLIVSNRRYEQLENDNKELQEKIKRLDTLFDILVNRNQELKTQVEDLIIENQQLQQKINHRNEWENQLKTQIHDLNEECKVLKIDKDDLQKQIVALNEQYRNHDLQLTEIWMKINQTLPHIDLQKSNDQNVSSEETIETFEESIPPEEETYYKKCKEYFHITQMPLISVSDDLFQNDTNLTSIYLIFVIDVDYNEFDAKIFLKQICEIFNTDDIVIRKIQIGCVKVITEIFKDFLSVRRKINIKAFYDSLTDRIQDLAGLKVIFMYMGNIQKLPAKQELRYEINLYPKYNRIYDIDHSHWTGNLEDGRDRGQHPYYCPVGWKRHSFYVTDQFYEKFKGWCICYHGTKFSNGLSILLSGLRPATAVNHGAGIYVTPSIIYASHPRYSEVKEIESTDEKIFVKNGKYVQFVLQCRVRPENIKKIDRETLDAKSPIIDPNISNDVIEWIIDAKNKTIMDFNDPNSTIVCTGLMVRVTDNHPGLLPESEWWFTSHLCPTNEHQHCMLDIDLQDLKQQKDDGIQCTILYE